MTSNINIQKNKKFSRSILNNVKSDNPRVNYRLLIAISLKGYRSLGKFAKDCEFTTSYLSMIINKKYKPTIKTAEIFCNKLGIGLNDVFDIPYDLQIPKESKLRK